MYMQDLKDFIQYCNNYYGVDGLYDMNASLEQIKDCCYLYITIVGDSFEGDTMDRERVRELLYWRHGLILDPTS